MTVLLLLRVVLNSMETTAPVWKQSEWNLCRVISSQIQQNRKPNAQEEKEEEDESRYEILIHSLSLRDEAK